MDSYLVLITDLPNDPDTDKPRYRATVYILQEDPLNVWQRQPTFRVGLIKAKTLNHLLSTIYNELRLSDSSQLEWTHSQCLPEEML